MPSRTIVLTALPRYAFLTLSLFALACTNARAQDKVLPPKKQSADVKAARSDRNIYAGIGMGGPASSHPAMNVHCNALVNESSPYLLQHAWNPVNWRPWSEAAFDQAKKENKPIFLSVGYSTCHWCHVMEKESFESEETAAILNENFICIKLDREERPDLDEFYMAAVVEFNNGHGGWPMSLFLTADKKAFIGATYFRPGHFRNVLKKILGYWKNDRKALTDQAEQVTKSIRESKSVIGKEGKLDLKLCDATIDRSWGFFDKEHGGFGQRGPKFPRGMTALFMLRNYQRTKSEKALTMVKKTLTEMYEGGMYDQVGGGFHRYSVDRVWLVPHFEKMLYDNGILARVYAEGYRVTGDKEYKRIAIEIAEYFMRDMVLEHGGIASAEDADSAGEEGLFYLWTPEEIKTVLTAEEAKFVTAHYGMTVKGNFSDSPGHTILNIVKSLPEVAKSQKMTEAQAQTLRESAKAKLLAYRAKRIRPLRDDKIITAWSGLGISGIANVARLTGNPKILKTAQDAAAFVLKKLRRKDGRLLRRYRSEQAGFLGILDDYAYLTDGLLELYMADGQARWLKAALKLESETRRLFWDKKNGGFYKTASDVTDLVARSRDVSDGARPAGASIAAMNMIRIAELKRDDELRQMARKVVALEIKNAEQSPLAYVSLLSVLEQYQAAPQEILVVGPENKETRAMLAEINRTYLPNTVVVSLIGKNAEAIRGLLPKMTKDRISTDGKATVYLCKERVCLAPMTTLKELKKALKEK
ncbi:MAG: thioredoxin domain-containing protein [Planctomycetota bacterium]|nr:thioredoxin domain-containing protein [Planctomycetota bacterium]